MLPGKTYAPEDLLHVLRRRFWLLLLPLAIVSAATATYARFLPNRYQSRAVIVVLPQQVPEAYVKSGVTAKIGDRLPTIAQRILTRAKLESIIEQFNLYPGERRAGMMQDVYERMRDRDIHVQPVPNGDAFTVTYEGANASTTQKVTESLAALFKEQNLLDRERLSEGTSTFLETQLDEARRRLEEQEHKLEKYKEDHAGSLPSQLQANIAALQTAWNNVTAVGVAINQAKDRRSSLERQLVDLNDLAAAAAPQTPVGGASTQVLAQDANNGVSAPAGSTSAQLATARNNLANFVRRGFTDEYPAVRSLKNMITSLEAQAEAEVRQTPLSAGASPTPTLSPMEIARRARAADISRAMETVDRDITNLQEEEKRNRALTAQLQPRIDGVPGLESDMTALMRDYGVLQTVYSGMLAKKEEANVSKNLERQEIGEQFSIAEPARVADKPSSPNRQQINVIGIAAGLGIGLLMVGLLEYRDSSFTNDAEVTRLLALPVLAVVPVMHSETEDRKIATRRWVVGAGLGSVVAACLAVVIYTFVR